MGQVAVVAQHPDLIAVLARIGVALVLAGAVGLERELAVQPAGLRTHSLVALGAALFAIVGTQVVGTDPTRVAAQVVSGIGFLGGGAILREGATVKGLTTAATLWAAAAIGLASGLGVYDAAVATTIAALLVMIGLRFAERRFFPRKRGQLLGLDVEHLSLEAVLPAARAVLPPSRVLSIKTTATGEQKVELLTQPSSDEDLVTLATKLLALEGVRGVELRT